MTYLLRLTPVIACLSGLPVQAEEKSRWTWDFYASLRTQIEHVNPDNHDVIDSYLGLRDAYSRFGLNLHYRIDSATNLFAQIEAPFDSANFRLRDPYDRAGSGPHSSQSLRLALVGAEGPFGTLVLGKQWMPYYNAIAAPLDWFSSYYSGFATSTSSRVPRTTAWYSPEVKGFSLAGSWSQAHGNEHSPSRIDERRQATMSWTNGPLRLSAGVDDRDNPGRHRDRFYGLSGTWVHGDWYVAAKYERTDTDLPDAVYGDVQEAFNILGAWTSGRNTWKLMLARVEGFGGNIVHAGVDHRYNERLKMFIEFYHEAETAAITAKRKGLDGFDSAISGGNALMFGFHYDLF